MKQKYEKRYARNRNSITEEDQQLLAGARVCVIGCGGLGGYIIEELARLGVGSIRAVDPDVFEESNLNRQLMSAEGLLGRSKAVCAGERVMAVNSEVEVEPVQEFFTEEKGSDLLAGCSLAVDALDSVGARLALEDVCARLNIPLVHGAIGGWSGQVAVVMPGDNMLHRLYVGDEKYSDKPECEEAGTYKWESCSNCDQRDAQGDCREEEESRKDAAGNLPFTAAVVASLEATEATKLLLGREGNSLQGRLLVLDLLDNEYEVLDCL